MLKEVQTAVISLIKSKISQGYPKAVKPYTGALRSAQELKKQVRNTPVIHVGVRNADAKSDGVLGKSPIGTLQVDVYGFESNKSGKEENVNAGLELVDWLIDAIRGETITIDGNMVPLTKNVKITIEDDADPFISILTLNDIKVDA